MRTIIMVIIVTGSTLLGNGLWLQAKALLAQYLIADAWQNTLQTNQYHKPWGWADTWPVAKLSFPAQYQQKPLYVLEGIQGNSLAFGPGHMINTALPGKGGSIVIGGHRDTHFAVLQKLQLNDKITLYNAQGKQFVYTVMDLRIEDSRQQNLSISTEGNQLILVTCYPFNALRSGGPLRYVVYARKLKADKTERDKMAAINGYRN